MDIRLLDEAEPWSWPEDAGPSLLRALTDGGTKADERLLAARLAGDITVITDELAEALLATACRSDAPEDLRCQAAIALGPSLEYQDTMDPELDDDDDDQLSEKVVDEIQTSLQRLYADEVAPRAVRRMALEASIRSPREWHGKAVLDAYEGGEADWRLTAVFAMRWVKGFEAQILDALDSESLEVQYEAVCAAGTWAVDAAWPRVAGLVGSEDADKDLRLAAIEAVVWIRPAEAPDILYELTDSEDADLAAAAHEAIAMAEAASDDDFDDDELLDDD
jgi:hypothetical protein